MTTQETAEASAGDKKLAELRRVIDTGNFKSYMQISNELCIVEHLHLVLRGTRVVMPEKLRACTLLLAHEGHLGVVGTKQNLRFGSLEWIKLQNDIVDHVTGTSSLQGLNLLGLQNYQKTVAGSGHRISGSSVVRSFFVGGSRLLQPLL
jgi:hypothetical protein